MGKRWRCAFVRGQGGIVGRAAVCLDGDFDLIRRKTGFGQFDPVFARDGRPKNGCGSQSRTVEPHGRARWIGGDFEQAGFASLGGLV